MTIIQENGQPAAANNNGTLMPPPTVPEPAPRTVPLAAAQPSIARLESGLVLVRLADAAAVQAAALVAPAADASLAQPDLAADVSADSIPPGVDLGPAGAPVTVGAGLTLLPPRVKNVFVALAAFATAAIGAVSTLDVGHWTSVQTALVTTATGAGLACAAALTAHFWRGTAKEPVAAAASITAFAGSMLALGEGFRWWVLTGAQVAALGGLISALLGVGGALLARQQVTPVASMAPAYDALED